MSAVPHIWPLQKLVDMMGSAGGQHAMLHLSTEAVPPDLRDLIHYAEYWGRSDEEAEANKLVAVAPDEVLRNLTDVVAHFNSSLMGWLAGPEADSKKPSPEYVAFSVLAMAADYAKLVLRRRGGSGSR